MIEKKDRREAVNEEPAKLKPPVDEEDVATVLDPEVNLRDRTAADDSTASEEAPR